MLTGSFLCPHSLIHLFHSDTESPLCAEDTELEDTIVSPNSRNSESKEERLKISYNMIYSVIVLSNVTGLQKKS